MKIQFHIDGNGRAVYTLAAGVTAKQLQTWIARNREVIKAAKAAWASANRPDEFADQVASLKELPQGAAFAVKLPSIGRVITLFKGVYNRNRWTPRYWCLDLRGRVHLVSTNMDVCEL